MADAAQVVVLALGAVGVGSGVGAAEDLGERRTAAKLVFRVTACAGALRAKLQTCEDGAAGWRDVLNFDAVQAPFTREYVVDELERHVRVTWEATAAATFGVNATAHQLYANRSDLLGKISREIIGKVDKKDSNAVARALIAATAEMETAAAAQYPLPFTVVDEIIVDKTADMAAFRVLVRNGFAGGGIDELVSKANDNAIAWCTQLQKRKKSPPGAQPTQSETLHVSSGNPNAPDEHRPKFSDDWGDFG